MQTLEQLTDASKSAWGTISQWIEHARNHCDVIKKDQSSAERELFTMQMPTSSPMGAVIYETGGNFNPSWLVAYIGVRQF